MNPAVVPDPLDVVEQIVRARHSAKAARRLRVDPWQPIDVPPETGRLQPPAWAHKATYDRSELSALEVSVLLSRVELGMWNDLELITDCWARLRDERRKRGRRRLNRLLAAEGVRRVPWLDTARDVVLTVPRRPPGIHHVYAILLGGYGAKRTEYGIYVGQTSSEPEQRLMQHLCGTRRKKGGPLSAGVVRRRGIELLPTVIGPLARVEEAVAKDVEREVADALRAAGIRVESG